MNQVDQVVEVERLALVLERLVRTLRFTASLDDHSPASASALRCLLREGDLRVTELARAEQVSQPAMTQLVGRLENEGLVARTASEHDRRAVVVSLTPKGEQVVARRRERTREALHTLVEQLDAAEQEAVATALPALEHLAEVFSQAP